MLFDWFNWEGDANRDLKIGGKYVIKDETNVTLRKVEIFEVAAWVSYYDQWGVSDNEGEDTQISKWSLEPNLIEGIADK